MADFVDYWNKFQTCNSKGEKIYDGILFEELIEKLLYLMYGQKWQKTGTTHDGNKDFYLLKSDERFWAECKNYKGTIELKTLAPTLVMAQVCDADVILFFSRSSINKYAKEKITSFGYKSSKKIVFYDAEILESLILKYNDKLPTEFQVPQDIQSQISKEINPLNVSVFFFPSVFSCMITEEDNYKRYTTATILHYNEPFSLLLTCCNNSIESGELEISFAEDNEDRKHYEYLNSNISLNSMHIDKVHLDPGESKAFLINLRVSIFKPSILLPQFTLRFITSNDKTIEWTSKRKSVECKWVGRTKLIGVHYNNIIEKVESNLVENTKFSAMLLVGGSGTGKSRILQECNCPLLKYGYRILELNVTKEHLSSVLLKELIYFLYEVPAELIGEVLKVRLEGLSYEETYSNEDKIVQISQMIEVIEKNNFQEFMKSYKEVLFEKMAEEKIAIIIDNMQFAANDFQEFWRSYIKYSVNQCRANKSIFITSVNSDYMTQETSKTIYTLKNSNICRMVDEIATGFKEEKQGILFLRELIHISDNTYDELFKDIISAVSLNPFYLYQMVKLMEEDEVIRQLSGKQGYIFSTEATWKTTWKIPGDINDTLKRRISFIIEHLDSEKLYNILSACYLLETLDQQKMKLFNINTTDLEFLAEHQILLHSDTGYCFAHDIIRRFYEQQYRDKRLYCLQNSKLVSKAVMQYNIIHKLVKIYIDKDDQYIITFCEKRNIDNISTRLKGVFLETLFDFVIESRSVFKNDIKWISTLNWICDNTRSFIGSIKALEFYNRACDCIENEIEDLSCIYCRDLRQLFHSHCDIYIQMHQRDNAVEFANKVLKATKIEPRQNPDQSMEEYSEVLDEYYVLKAIMYNRIFCAFNNHYPTESIVTKRNKAIAKSRELIPFIRNSYRRNLISYLNDSDEGYRYYGLFSDYNSLMSIWKKCLIDIPNICPEKTMNYYRKCVQYSLIQQKEKETQFYIEKGRDYLENGAYSHEPLIFNTFFTMAEAVNCLQHNPDEMYSYIESLLDDLVKVQLLLRSDKLGDIYLLKGVNAYYYSDKQTVYDAFKKAYIMYNEKETTNYWIKRELIKENIITAYSALNISSKDFDISFLSQECIDQLQNPPQNGVEAKGIIRTKDLLFNLPLVV